MPQRRARVAGFGGRPAIAVLAFTPVTDTDPNGSPEDAELLARGVTDELVTHLSRVRSLPILSATATAGYWPDRGLRQTADQLDVAYFVRGSVRRGEKEIRTTAQLLDAETQQVLWAATYDRKPEDFPSQHDILCEDLLEVLDPGLLGSQPERAPARADLEAWASMQRGLVYMRQVTRVSNQTAKQQLRRALEIEPELVPAYGLLGTCLMLDVLFQWNEEPRTAVEEALHVTEEGVKRDSGCPFARHGRGSAYALDGRMESAIQESLQAIALSPSYALAYWGAGRQLALSGRADEGLALLRTACRLSPGDPLMDQFLADTCVSFFSAGAYEDAIRYAEESVRLRGVGNWAWPFLIASYVRTRRVADAIHAADRMKRARFSLRISRLEAQLQQMQADAALVRDLTSALRSLRHD